MKVSFHIDERELRELVIREFCNKVGVSVGQLNPNTVKIETKSKQNYRSEWESGAGFRASYEGDI